MGEMAPRNRALLCLTGNKHKADRITCFDTLTTATVDQMNAVKELVEKLREERGESW